MYGYYTEKFHVNHFWELKGQEAAGETTGEMNEKWGN